MVLPLLRCSGTHIEYQFIQLRFAFHFQRVLSRVIPVCFFQREQLPFRNGHMIPICVREKGKNAYRADSAEL